MSSELALLNVIFFSFGFIFCLFVCCCCSCCCCCCQWRWCFFLKKWYKLDCIFLQSYVVNFPTLNKVLLTDSLNFARKNFRVFRVFDFSIRVKIETRKPRKFPTFSNKKKFLKFQLENPRSEGIFEYSGNFQVCLVKAHQWINTFL